MASREKTVVQLPAEIVGRADVIRLSREITAVNDHFEQALLRNQPTNTPPVSEQLSRLAEINRCDLSLLNDRTRLELFLKRIKQDAPTLQMTFAAEPNLEVVKQVVEWLRRELSSYTLLEVGLQPAIVAGCKLRTTNKIFDFSLRNSISNNRSLLIDKLRSL